ncbi:MAG: hypothetical protein ACREIA_22030 [Opitutaceae bacterium]
MSATVAVSPPVAPAPSSLAAKAASEAAERAPASVGKTNVPTPTEPPPEAAREKTNDAAAVPPAPVADVNGNGVVVAKNDAEEILLVIDGREYRVRGLAKNTGFESLKVTLRAACGERWHLDQVDLCVARQRENFVAAAAVETNLRPELLKRDLGKILGKLEELQEARLRAETAPKKPEAAIPAALLDKARALARDPRLWELIPEHAALCGIAGERVNVRVGYLGTVSRLLDRPLAIIIQSSSAAGKTTLMDAILAFVPPERRIKYSAMTGQSLFYMAGTDLKHKILAIVEEAGAEKASYALKLLQSEGELSIASTGKDPHTGRMESQEYHVEGPVMIILTTTAVDLDEELQNRALVLTVDESREQTERIHALQREARTEAGIARKAQRAELLALHRAMQSLLQPLPVFNPYADRLRFLSHQLRTRRDHEKYQLLIDSLALLFQHQRARKTIAGREHVVATLDDIARANELAHEVLGRGLDDMPPQTRRLLGLIQDMQRERAVKPDAAATTPRDPMSEHRRVQGLSPCWRRRELRAVTGWGDTQLKIHLGRLVELEYVLASRDPEHLNGQLYELMFDGDVQAAKPHLSGLIDVEALRRAGNDRAQDGSGASPQGYEENRSGPNEDRSEVGRPSVGGQSGGGRPGENEKSSSEKCEPHGPSSENAQPGGAENAA